MPLVWRRLAAGSYVVTTLVILFLPGKSVPPSVFDVDKIIHVGMFFGLVFVCLWALSHPLYVFLASTAYAVLSEPAQQLLAIGRTGSISDALADLLGVILAWGVYRWQQYLRSRSS